MHRGRGLIVQLWAITMLIGTATDPGYWARAQVPNSSGHFYHSLRGMHVAGYQGWFACPGDGGDIGWGHWFRGGADPRDPNSMAIDIWPDTSELDRDELCPTAFHLPSGAPAYLFSDRNPKTVARHFRWMHDYGLDGAAMQRFTAGMSKPAMKAHLDAVLINARTGAEANNRGFFVMYDVSGMNGEAALRVIEADWPHLTEELRVTQSPAYIYDRGHPVVGVWGLGFKDRDVSAEQASAILHYFKTAPVAATVLGGVPASWRNLGTDGRWPDSRADAGWASVYRSFDIISPWSVGRYQDDSGADDFAHWRVGPDLVETRRLGIEYMPVIFPGFSFHNGALPSKHVSLNAIPRRCGAFYRNQISAVLNGQAASMVFTAMFDEVNEGTAIFKMIANPSLQPERALLLALNSDNCTTAKPDMYLRMAGLASGVLTNRLR